MKILVEENWDGADGAKPDVSFIPAMERRRLTALEKAALAVAHAALARLAEQEGAEAARALPVVFASRWGEIGTTLKLIRQMHDEGEMSPAGFANSVHNAAPGHLSLLTQNHSPYTAVAAGGATREAGLLEASTIPGRVLFIFAEEATPEFYRAHFEEVERARATALIVENPPEQAAADSARAHAPHPALARLRRAARLAAPLALAFALSGCTRHASVEQVEWPVMGTIASFKCRDAADLPKAAAVRETFAEIEKLLNAHDPASELSRLAAAELDDEAVLARCSPRVRDCYAAAFRFRDASGGAFDPRWRGRATLDLGGIAKGYALDLAAARIGECDALLDLGGNLKACGGKWRAGIYGSSRVVELTRGMSLSTSGRYFRGDHIKDARSGETAAPSAFSVTVVHPQSAMDADALSTILFILGEERSAPFLEAHAPSASAIWTGP